MTIGLSEKQATSIREATARINVWDGAVSGGKTFASELAWLDWIANAPPGPLLMVGHTLTTLEENILWPLADQLLPDFDGAVQHTRGSTTSRILGRQVRVMGASDRTAEGKIRGMSLAGAYVDEATLVPEDFWNMLDTRLRIPGARLFATTNPDNPNHWLKQKWLDRADGVRIARWRFLMNDNPTLSDEYMDHQRSQHSGLFYRRFIEGEWVAAQGAIYDMLDFDDTDGRTPKHRPIGTPTLTDHCWLGVDYGTFAPFHAVLIQLGVDDRMYVTGEWRWDSQVEQRQLDPTEYELRLREWLRSKGVWPHRIAVDPSAAEFRALLRNRGWVGLTTSDEQINPVKAGIQAVSGLLASRRLVFVKGAAPELEKELLGYVWDEKAQEQGEDRPLKQDDHGADALRYVVMASRKAWRPWLSVESR